MERAAPDVKLLIEAAAEIEKDRINPRRNRPKVVSPWSRFSWQWVLVLLISGTFISLLIWIVQNAVIRPC